MRDLKPNQNIEKALSHKINYIKLVRVNARGIPL